MNRKLFLSLALTLAASALFLGCSEEVILGHEYECQEEEIDCDDEGNNEGDEEIEEVVGDVVSAGPPDRQSGAGSRLT